MLITVIGASASGKSSFAESLIDKYEGERFYIATMACMDEESKERIKKHQTARSGKGFSTIECPTNLNRAFEQILEHKAKDSTEWKAEDEAESASRVVLLECMSNLLANEMYDEQGNCKNRASYFEELNNWIINPIKAFINPEVTLKVDSLSNLEEKNFDNMENPKRILVVVTGEVFMDGYDYDPETLRYMEGLGKINSQLVAISDEAYEVVCGIPVKIKTEQ